MIISNSQIMSLLQTYAKQDSKHFLSNKVAGKLQKPAPAKDETNVSETAKAYQMAKEVLKDIPDIRENRLKELASQVRTGTYEVSVDDIAEKMLGRNLVDKLV